MMNGIMDLHVEIEGLQDTINLYKKAFDEIVEELRKYQGDRKLQERSGWKDTFYDGIEYAVDVISEARENIENADSD